MAAVAVSVAPAAALTVTDEWPIAPFYYGGVVEGGTFFVGEFCTEIIIPREQFERIKAELENPSYFINPRLLDGGRPFKKRQWEFSR